MYCYKCGQQVADNAAFCAQCGAPVNKAPQGAPQPPQPAPQPPSGQTAPPSQPAGAPPVYQAPAQPAQTPPADTAVYQAPPVQPVQPPPPPVEAVSPAAVGLDNAIYSGISVVPQRRKTKVDTVCGVVFLLLGVVALGVYGFAVAGLLMQGGFAGMFPMFSAFSDVRFLASLLSLGYLFALVAGVLMVLGGVFALSSGRGRKPAYTAIVLMLFTLAFDAIYLVLMDMWGHLSVSIGQKVMASFFIYAFEVIFVLAPTILLFFKRQAKRRARTTLLLQSDNRNRKSRTPLEPLSQPAPRNEAAEDSVKHAVGMDTPPPPPPAAPGAGGPPPAHPVAEVPPQDNVPIPENNSPE